MQKTTLTLFIMIAITSVALADVLIKKMSINASTFSSALRNPLLIVVIFLYIVQILIFLYVFLYKAELGIVGMIATPLYALIVVGSGILFFGESLSLVNVSGMILALVGVVLLEL